MGPLELFLHEDRPDLPVLVKAALVHVQFETIHPFLDGNGRLGRLLIAFLLCAVGALREPILYLSLFFKANRRRYYDLLQRVREAGDWETWLEFFLTGVKETAEQAADTARQTWRFSKPTAAQSKDSAERRPRRCAFTSSCSGSRSFRFRRRQSSFLSAPTVTKAIEHMIKLGILRKITGKQRQRLFVYDQYLTILNQGTEPLPR